jgi:hypothetical protein
LGAIAGEPSTAHPTGWPVEETDPSAEVAPDPLFESGKHAARAKPIANKDDERSQDSNRLAIAPPMDAFAVGRGS